MSRGSAMTWPPLPPSQWMEKRDADSEAFHAAGSPREKATLPQRCGPTRVRLPPGSRSRSVSDEIVTSELAATLQAEAMRRHAPVAWIVFQDESDYPGKFVARLVATEPTTCILLADTLTESRSLLPAGLVLSERQPADQPRGPGCSRSLERKPPRTMRALNLRLQAHYTLERPQVQASPRDADLASSGSAPLVEMWFAREERRR
jgi:hypothetical protein